MCVSILGFICCLRQRCIHHGHHVYGIAAAVSRRRAMAVEGGPCHSRNRVSVDGVVQAVVLELLDVFVGFGLALKRRPTG